MINRPILKARGKYAFKHNYWPAVLAGIVNIFFAGGFYRIFKITFNLNSGMGYAAFMNSYEANKQFIYAYAAKGIGFIMMTTPLLLAFYIFICAPLLVGVRKFFLKNAVGNGDTSDLMFAFSDNYLNIVKTEFFKAFWIFIWSLLLIIPGIIKAYAYGMTDYILAENPNMDTDEILKRSEEMMMGHKWEYFVFHLSFIGWIILTSLIGILNIFWTQPYILASETEYYRTLSGKTKDGMYNFNGHNYNNPQPDDDSETVEFESQSAPKTETSQKSEKEFIFKG